MENTKIITFVARLDAFHFLGAETILTENTDFGAVWERFFALGGYAPIEPFQTDPSCVNIWRRTEEHAAYIQGKFVAGSAAASQGYALETFPAGEYLVVTTEWLPTYEDSMQHINHDYYKNAEIPAGYRLHEEDEGGIFLIERWGAQSESGYRYEFWLPLEKI